MWENILEDLNKVGVLLYYNITENSAILYDIGYKFPQEIFPQEILNLILNAIAPEDIINIIKHANLENISYDVLESQMGGEDSGINNSL